MSLEIQEADTFFSHKGTKKTESVEIESPHMNRGGGLNSTFVISFDGLFRQQRKK